MGVNKPRVNCFPGGEVSVFSGNEVRTISLFLVLSRFGEGLAATDGNPTYNMPKIKQEQLK